MRIAFLNFEFGLAATHGYYEMLFYWRYPKYPAVIGKINKFIHDEHIDVMGFAEVNFPHQAEVFGKTTGMHTAGETVYQNPVLRAMRQGNLLLSNFPIKDHQIIRLPGKSQPRGIVCADIETDKGTVTALVTHLSLGKTARREQIKTLCELCEQTENPFILMGDFNSFDWEEDLKPLQKDSGLISLNLGPTYPSWNPQKRLDHIFLSPDFKVQKAEVYHKDRFSDHAALIAEIS